MSAPKHTPGPWRYVTETDFNGEFFGCGVATSEGGPEFIWFDDCIDDETDIANARLIAAAPDMLRTLKSADFAFELAGYAPDSIARESIRAVIAKAEGRA